MWLTSTEFAAEVRSSSQRVVTSCQVWDSSGLLATLTPNSGEVTVDRTRAVRRDLKTQLADPDGTLTPADARDLLAPYGNELRVWRGLWLPVGTTELVPLGVFRITAAAVASGANGVVVDLVGADRSRQVSRNRWAAEWQVAAGTEVSQAITDLLLDRYPDVELDLPDTGYACGAAVLEAGDSSDPWRDAQDLAASAGLRLAFDPAGVARLYAPREYTGPADAMYTDTTECVLLSVGREMSDEDVYSGVIATGESSSLDTPVRGEAWDDDPGSPTYADGKFGRVPRFYSSPFLATADQCASAAAGLLADSAGGAQALEWEQIVNPAHDADDLVDVVEAGSRTNARIVLDSLTIPLAADQAMSATGRVRRLA